MSRAADRELDLVSRRLRAAGIPVVRLNAESATDADLLVDTDRGAARIRGRWITPTVTWVRHFSARAIPQEDGQLRRIFTGQSWQYLVDQLGTISAAQLAARAPGTLEQLAAARRCGIAVPRTIVTADLPAACHLLRGPRVVIKAVHQHFVEATPGLLTGVFPEITDLDELAAGLAAGSAARPPVIIQDYVDHEQEIRAYYTLGQVTAFAISKDYPAQLWLHPEAVTAARIEPTKAITEAVQMLATAMSLEYGAFDFLSADGVPVFLEVNVSGDWCWLETKTGAATVTIAVCSMLAELHHRVLGNGGSPGRSQLDPVRFLTGGLPPAPG